VDSFLKRLEDTITTRNVISVMRDGIKSYRETD
jgi:hypothetical protein